MSLNFKNVEFKTFIITNLILSNLWSVNTFGSKIYMSEESFSARVALHNFLGPEYLFAWTKRTYSTGSIGHMKWP